MPFADALRDFFLRPSSLPQLRYEVLRSHFVEGLSIKEMAKRFEINEQMVQTLLRDFKRAKDRDEKINLLGDTDELG
jgi:DNA-directed RNA polymerase specialized sigma24 family protein